MYAVIRHYHFKKEDSKKIDKIVQESLVPMLKKVPGFVRYYWLDTGKGEGASLSVFNDKAGADKSIQVAAELVKAELPDVLTQKPEIIEGPIKGHS
jgi:hypothetical protein